MSSWTEGVCDDGVAILRDGRPVTISEMLAILNRAEDAVAMLQTALSDLLDAPNGELYTPTERNERSLKRANAEAVLRIISGA